MAALLILFPLLTTYSATFGTNSAQIVNRYLPQNPGAQWSYRGFGELEGATATTLATGIETVDGVRCVRTDATTGVSEWHAQDTSGAVWRLRELDDPDDYLMMPASPVVGQEYDLWILRYRVISTTAVVTTPAGTFSNCLHLKCVDESWPDLEEYYAPGVGEIKSFDSTSGYELTAFSGIDDPPVPAVEITAIWSEQTAGSRQNLLPGMAGQRGNLSGYLLMGTRADGQAHIGVAIQLHPDIPSADVRARLVRINGQALVPITTQVSRAGNDFILVADPSYGGADTVSDFRVEAWVEVNGDGIPTPGAGETRTYSPWAVRVITPSRYALCTSGISGEIMGMRAIQWRYAADFAQLFLDGTVPAYVTSSSNSQLIADNELSHHVGALFPAAGAATVREYTFDTGTCISRSVMDSVGLHSFLAQIVASSRSEIQSFFNNNPSSQYCFLYPPNSTIMFSDDRDVDLAFSIHGANVQNVVITVPRQRSESASVSGSLRDLYDWDFEGANNSWMGAFMDPMYASAQAGYGSLGNAGRVFRILLQFIGPVASVHYDGSCCLRLGLDGLKARIDLFGLPGDEVAVDESTDLKTWQQRSSLVLPASGVSSLERPLSDEGRPVYFRSRTIRSGGP